MVIMPLMIRILFWSIRLASISHTLDSKSYCLTGFSESTVVNVIPCAVCVNMNINQHHKELAYSF